MPTKVHLVKAMLFPVVMYGCESWTIKKAESWRLDAFEVWCWRRLLRVPWTVSTSNQSILKEISPEYSLEGLMLKLKLKLQYFGHLMQRTDSFEKTWCWERLRVEEKGMTEDEMVGWHHWLSGHESEQTRGVGDGQGGLVCCSLWGHRQLDMTEWLNWTEIIRTTSSLYYFNSLIAQLMEKAMAPHSSTLAWKIPWMEEAGGPQSIGSLRVRHDWVTSLSLFTFMHWRRKWQPTPVFLPGESQG